MGFRVAIHVRKLLKSWRGRRGLEAVMAAWELSDCHRPILAQCENITGVRTTFFAVTAGQLVPQTVSAVGINAFGIPSSANVNGQGNVGRVLQFAAKVSF